MNIAKVIRERLQKEDADGLVNLVDDCHCWKHDLFPCDRPELHCKLARRGEPPPRYKPVQRLWLYPIDDKGEKILFCGDCKHFSSLVVGGVCQGYICDKQTQEREEDGSRCCFVFVARDHPPCSEFEGNLDTSDEK